MSNVDERRKLLIASSLYDGIEDRRTRYVLTILQDEDADPNYILHHRGIAPIHLAIGHENKSFALEITMVLLQYGANPNVCSTEGMTPVHIAAAWGRARLLRLLLLNGGNPWLEDDDGKNAFHFAFEENHSVAMQVLENFRLKDVGKYDDWVELCDPNPKYTIALDKVLLYNQEVLMSYQASVPFAAHQCRSAGTQTSPEPAAAVAPCPAPAVARETAPRAAGPSVASTSALDRFRFVLSDIRDKVVSQVTLRKVNKRPLSRRTNFPPATGLSFIDELRQRQSAGLRHRATQMSPPAIAETRLISDEVMVRVTPSPEPEEAPAEPAEPAEIEGTPVRRQQVSDSRSPDMFESQLDRAFLAMETDVADDSCGASTDGSASASNLRLDLHILEVDAQAALHGPPTPGAHTAPFSRDDEHAFVNDMNASFGGASPAANHIASNAMNCRSSTELKDNISSGINKNSCGANGTNDYPSGDINDFIPKITNSNSCEVNCKTNSGLNNSSCGVYYVAKNGLNDPTSGDLHNGIPYDTDTSNGMKNTSRGQNHVNSNKIIDDSLNELHDVDNIPYGMKNSSFGIIKKASRVLKRTFLDKSCHEMQPSIVDVDLGEGADIVPASPGTESCLMITARSEISEGMLEDGSDAVNEIDGGGDQSERNVGDNPQPAVAGMDANSNDCRIVWENGAAASVMDGSCSFFSCRDAGHTNDTAFLAASQDEVSTDVVAISFVSIPGEMSTEFISDDEECFDSEQPSACKLPPPDSMLIDGSNGPEQQGTSECNGSPGNVACNGEDSNRQTDLPPDSKNKFPNGRFSWASDCDSFVSASEEYVYTDEEEGVVLLERRFLVPPAATGAVSSSELSSDGSEPAGYDTDGLRSELRKHGIEPGPILPSTKRVYLKKLQRAARGKAATGDEKQTYSSELDRSLRQAEWDSDLTQYEALEREMSAQFCTPDPRKCWREGVLKSSFCYLLLDPRVTANLPCRVATTPARQAWATFLEAVFYVGKGKRSRPYAHLYQAVGAWKSGARAADDKTRQIVDIWSAGLGVVCLHVFQNVIPAEAYTREAAMLDALTLARVRNARRSEYYGVAAAWPAKRRNMLGTLLLHKAMRIFLSEGERQLRPDSKFSNSSFPLLKNPEGR